MSRFEQISDMWLVCLIFPERVFFSWLALAFFLGYITPWWWSSFGLLHPYLVSAICVAAAIYPIAKRLRLKINGAYKLDAKLREPSDQNHELDLDCDPADALQKYKDSLSDRSK